MRLVLDTNVIISALLFDGAPERLVRAVLSSSHQLVISTFIINETSRILSDKFKIPPETVELLEQLLTEAEVVYFEPFLHILGDEPDNRVLETAVKGKAEYIVTGDKPLIALNEHSGVKIITVREFLKYL